MNIGGGGGENFQCLKTVISHDAVFNINGAIIQQSFPRTFPPH